MTDTETPAPQPNVVDRFAPISDQQIRDIMDCGDPSTARIKICRLIHERTKPAAQPNAVEAENAALRKIISDAAAALPNGAYIHPQASVGFMEGLPKEIALVCADLKAAAISTPPAPNVVGPADQIIGQIEELFPNWQAYRDLVDCIRCEIHDLRKRAEGK